MIPLLLLLFGCGERREITAVLTLDGDPTRGQAQYQMNCARCHGAEGGGIASNPALRVVVPDRTDPSIVDTVINGRGVMSAQRLDDQQVADVLAWMRTAWPLPPKE